ncbi:hypothetical protein EVAR_82774_1 [Eumeta japonica]|uniref:Uncharacterized protein n=1 Tax=Eumeta variegata TaxID=151549 RepID=A0A4C1UP52_EUMVA|nr:hypothetical protein EVAR_82774_1 [Eumeta japonica]
MSSKIVVASRQATSSRAKASDPLVREPDRVRSEEPRTFNLRSSESLFSGHRSVYFHAASVDEPSRCFEVVGIALSLHSVEFLVFPLYKNNFFALSKRA